jgi:DNA-binding NarL/FixJ family response regulator
MHYSEGLARDVLQAGARGCVVKADADEKLVAAVAAFEVLRFPQA